jgi:hypothetical protein
MVKDLKEEQEEPSPQQINRVEKMEINVGSGASLWLVLATLIVTGILLAKVNELERRLNWLKSNRV